MIINIGAKVEKLQAYFVSNSTINSLFPGGIYAGKPVDVASDVSLYFGLTNNTPLIETDRKGGKDLEKIATLEFVIVTNSSDVPDVVLYEALDTLSNEIVEKRIDLDGFIINTIIEGTQSGVLADVNENYVLIASYDFHYKNKY